MSRLHKYTYTQTHTQAFTLRQYIKLKLFARACMCVRLQLEKGYRLPICCKFCTLMPLNQERVLEGLKVPVVTSRHFRFGNLHALWQTLFKIWPPVDFRFYSIIRTVDTISMATEQCDAIYSHYSTCHRLLSPFKI